MNNIIITGGTGFLGSNIIRYYRENGVILKIMSREILNDLLKSCNNSGEFQCNSKFFQNFFTDSSTLIHVAGLAHGKKEINNDDNYISNYHLTKCLASVSKVYQIKHFIFVSSASIFSDVKHKLNISPTEPPNTSNSYGLMKLYSEVHLKNIADQNFNVSIVRPPMVYGYNCPGNLSILIKFTRKFKFLPVGCFHNNNKSFIYIENFVQFIYLVTYFERSKYFDIFHISDNDNVDTCNFIKLFFNSIKVKYKILFIPRFILKFSFILLGKSEVFRKLSESFTFDISDTCLKTGWYPKFNIHTAMEDIKLNYDKKNF